MKYAEWKEKILSESSPIDFFKQILMTYETENPTVKDLDITLPANLAALEKELGCSYEVVQNDNYKSTKFYQKFAQKIKDFQESSEEKNIFQAIRTMQIESVKRFLNEKDIVNATDDKYHRTPLMTVIVEMGKLYSKQPPLTSVQILEQLTRLQAIAFDIIKHNPEITQVDKKDNNVFHLLYKYANNGKKFSKTQAEANIFIEIAQSLLGKLDPWQFIAISEQENKTNQTCLNNLYGVSSPKVSAMWKSPTLIQKENQKAITPYIHALILAELSDSLEKCKADSLRNRIIARSLVLRAVLEKAKSIKGLEDFASNPEVIKIVRKILKKDPDFKDPDFARFMTEDGHPILKEARKDRVTGRYYDMDGCLLAKFNLKRSDQSLYAWFIENHKNFLDKEIEKIKAGKFNQVVLGYFTNRQDFWTDDSNAKDHKTITCVPILLIAQDYYQKQLGENVEVIIDPFLMADIASNPENGGNKKAGDSYKLMLKHRYSDVKKDDWAHAHALFDTTKTSLAYIIPHRLLTLIKHAEAYHIALVDDLDYLLDHGYGLVKTNPGLFPTCVFEFIQYNGAIQSVRSIAGTGKTDENYEWTIRCFYLFHMLGRKTAQETFEAHAVKIRGKTLQQHHAIRCYRDAEALDRPFPASDPSLFQEYRDTVLAEIKETQLGVDSNYTTLEELYKEGCISAKSLQNLGFILLAPTHAATVSVTTCVPQEKEKKPTGSFSSLFKPSESLSTAASSTFDKATVRLG